MARATYGMIGKMKAAVFYRWVRRRSLSFAMLFTAAAICAGVLFFAHQSADRQIAMIQAAELAEDKAVSVAHAEIKARKQAEEEARREQEAARVAEQARTADATTARAIDAVLCNKTGKHADPARIDVLVNKKHCLQPLHYAPVGLVAAHGATLRAEAAAAFASLFQAAAAAGQPLVVTSSYRSYESQVATYQHWVRQSGAVEADTYSARPGYSEHQTGLAVDVAAGSCALSCFGQTSQYVWLQNNAHKYGFVQRYQKGSEAVTGYIAEEWHYRYVGVAAAKDMKERGVATLEAYWGIPGGDY